MVVLLANPKKQRARAREARIIRFLEDESFYCDHLMETVEYGFSEERHIVECSLVDISKCTQPNRDRCIAYQDQFLDDD